jgi:hypothetical protein
VKRSASAPTHVPGHTAADRPTREGHVIDQGSAGGRHDRMLPARVEVDAPVAASGPVPLRPLALVVQAVACGDADDDSAPA